MSVPETCTVLVVGGGPAGSYAASVLAREGIDTVNGAVFRLAQGQPDAYTDFLEAGGPEGYAWNLLRAESDDLLFRHAGSCGAHIFDETKVDTIQFVPGFCTAATDNTTTNTTDQAGPGRPVSATWTRHDGTSGSLSFNYLVDASGRRGLLSTKYLKNRKFNDNFKNVASWAYWKSENLYGEGTHMYGAPYFEALDDASGWAWFMPLHDGTRSVGIVQHQKLAADKKRELGHPSALQFYTACLEMAPGIKKLLSGAELVADLRSASDWSYTASDYHLTNARICGDAGSFIDPLFSSGVHLAITGGLSAAVTIAASIKGDCDERTAGSWHSKKTVESYTRFFLAVSSATKQIRMQHEPIIQDMDEVGFQRAFDLFRPIIQGATDDVNGASKLSTNEIPKILEFCFQAFTYVPHEKKEALFVKLKSLGVDSKGGSKLDGDAFAAIQDHLTPDEMQILEILRSRRMVREDPFEMDSFTLDTIDGLAPNLVRGELGLAESKQAKIDKSHFYSTQFLNGTAPGIREGSIHLPTSKVKLN
ncbi:hypothetical protein LLEC1_04213 [Akanthomyces lecanii]|uniref:FAD-binding domain-containing protein n=1 Tax=Cordyceps confragosa TaxID=2714763 RepID=A0A179I527_CORDF|nr:hypothetical protein LLEC1_04213 [Akanthomyces lecanii]